jgi:hypothetical protein
MAQRYEFRGHATSAKLLTRATYLHTGVTALWRQIADQSLPGTLTMSPGMGYNRFRRRSVRRPDLTPHTYAYLLFVLVIQRASAPAAQR